MTPEQLKQLAHELKTQDNRCNAFPLYAVEQERRIYGLDPEYTENHIYQWRDDPEYFWETEEQAMKEVLEANYKEEDFDNIIEKVGYVVTWEFVTAHLTEKAAKRYVDENSHNLKSPRIYVTSQYRCHEFNDVVNYLKGFREEDVGDALTTAFGKAVERAKERDK